MTGRYYDYYWYIPRLCCLQFIVALSQKKPWNCHHKSDPACTDALRGGGQHAIPSKRVQSIFYWAFIYDRYMPGICMSYLSTGRFRVRFSCTPLSCMPGLPSAPGRVRPGLSADPFGFGNRKPPNSRLGPAKVPQPGDIKWYKPIIWHVDTYLHVKSVGQAFEYPGNSLIG